MTIDIINNAEALVPVCLSKGFLHIFTIQHLFLFPLEISNKYFPPSLQRRNRDISCNCPGDPTHRASWILDIYRIIKLSEMQTLVLNFMILQGLGIWPPSGTPALPRRLLYKLHTFFVLFIVFVYMVTGIIGSILTIKSVMEFAHYGCRLLPSAVGVAKLLNVIISHKTIVEIIDTLETDPCRPRDAEENLLQQEYNRKMQKITIQYGIITYLTTSLIISHTIQYDVPVKKLPRIAWFPYDYSDGTMYWFTLSYQLMIILLFYSTTIGYDTLVCGLFFMLSAKLNILQYRFMNLHETLKKQLINDGVKSDISEIERNLIADCVNYHLLAKKENSTFSAVIFSQVVFITIVLFLTAYNISRMPITLRIVSVVLYLLNMLLTIFLYCACGNEVTIESENVSKAIIDIDWMSFTPSTLKCVIIIASYSRRPIIIRCGYFVTLSLDLFKSIVKVAYSVFNALKSLQ